MITPKQLEEYAKVCKKHGISSLNLGSGPDTYVNIQLDPLYTPPPKLTRAQIKKDEELRAMAEMSEEDLALYSAVTPGLSE